MGKKRRILRSPKFAALRRHSKFKGLTEANLAPTQEEKPEEIVEPVVLEKIVELAEPEVAPPPATLIEKPEPKPEPKYKKTSRKVSAKKTPSTKKPKTRRSSKKKTVTQSAR